MAPGNAGAGQRADPCWAAGLRVATVPGGERTMRYLLKVVVGAVIVGGAGFYLRGRVLTAEGLFHNAHRTAAARRAVP